MRPRLAKLAIVAAFGACGCGTVMNLASLPGPTPTPEIMPETCSPFGGVKRSALGTLYLARGYMAPFGLVWLIDTPVSLVSDLVTLPVAYARQQDYRWATWWGKQPFLLSNVKNLVNGPVEGWVEADPSDGPGQERGKPQAAVSPASP